MIVFNRFWETMKAKNMSTYRLRETYNISPSTIRKLRKNEVVNTDTLSKFCTILDCQLEDIAEFIPDNLKD